MTDTKAVDAELLDEIYEDSSREKAPDFPKGWEPRVTLGAWDGEAVSGTYPDDGDEPDEDALIRGWRLDPEQWSIVDGSLICNRWQVMTKGYFHYKDDEVTPNKTVWHYQYKAHLRKRITDANLPLGLRITPNFNVKVTGRGRRKKAELPDENWLAGGFFPDPQFGFWWDEFGELHTIHDERCFDIRNQVFTDARSEFGKLSMIVGAGDTGDFTHFSKFTSAPNYVERTLQHTLDRVSLEWQQLRAIEPEGELWVLDGNHDNPRLIQTLIRKGMSSLVGLRQGGTDPSDDPVLSVQHLTQMDRWGIKYVEPFPTGRVQFNDSLGCAHGPAYSSKKGGTALKILAQAQTSMLHGHTHREESMSMTMWTSKGPRTYYVESPGTFCRTDLVVPSAKTNPTSKGTPAVGTGTEDWQQGFYIVLYDPSDGGHFEIERVRIWNREAHLPSVAYWRGRRYESTCDADGNEV